MTTGVSCLSDHDWETQARFANAPAGVGGFTTRLDTPDVIGRIGAGIEVFNEGSLNVRAQYKADLGIRQRAAVPDHSGFRSLVSDG